MGVRQRSAITVYRANLPRLAAPLLFGTLLVTSCGALAETASDPRSSEHSRDSSDIGFPRLEAETTAPSETSPELATTVSSPAVPPSGPDNLVPASTETVPLRFESRVSDVSDSQLEEIAMTILNDARGWNRAGFTFETDPASEYRVVLAEGKEVDDLCLPLDTGGSVSCQNGPVVALNADRWRSAVSHWDSTIEKYRGYLLNHEVGHLIGQTHPTPRCPTPGQPAGVMEQQTGGLEGCVGNVWPRDWEIAFASQRPAVYAPLPAWKPETPAINSEGR